MKWDWKKLNLKDKNTWLILGLFGVLLLVIAMPVDGTSKSRIQVATQQETEQEKETKAEENVMDETEALERRLEETLSLIDGAGRVRVMITMKDTGEKVVEKDISRRLDANSDGTEQTDLSEGTVYERDGSLESPYISNELTPQVEGVLVVAQGAGNSLVKQNILQGVLALFPLEAHKITIVKMSMQEDGNHENL